MKSPHPHGRVAVITGATGAIGEAVTTALIDTGATTALLARNARHLERLRAHLPSAHPVSIHAVDVTQAYEIVEARDEILDRWGPPDLLVVSAGILRASPFERAVPADWDGMLQVNLKGLMQTVQIFAPDVLAAGARGGRADIVLVGSGLAPERQGDFAVYSALGAAVDQLSKHLRVEFGPRGVRVHYVAPLFTATKLGTDVSSAENIVFRSELAAVNAISPDRVASTIEFMTSLPPHVNLASAAVQPTGTR